MTFLHKLAKRLARIPTLATTLGLFAACADGTVQDYLGPDPNSPSNFVSLSISPQAPHVAVGDSVRLSALGWLSSGKTASIAVTWSASGGSISQGGWFHPNGVGDFLIRAVATARPSLADSVQVASFNQLGGITRLEVLPAVTAVPKGTSQQFVAQAVMQDGSTTLPTVAWSATGGTITATGLFTATGSVGTASVSATLGAGMASAQSDVAIQPAILSQLILDPSSVIMEAGETRQLTVAASWSDGASNLPPIIWAVQGGTLNAQNVFTAGSAPGMYRLIVASPSFAKADTSLVWVLPRLIGLRLSPATATLAPGALLPIQAFAIRNDGSETAAGIQWTATGGSVTLDGKYTAGSSVGMYRVIGTLHSLNGQTLVDTARMSITSGSGTLIQMAVLPHAPTVTVGNSLQFTVSGGWSDGTSAVPAVTWTAIGGTLDQTGLFTAGPTPGTSQVIATQFGGGRADTAVVTTIARLLAFRIVPKVDTIVAGHTRQFSATLNWSDGLTHPATISWATNTPGGSISPSGVYSPGVLAGAFLVIATCGCGAADTATISVQTSSAPGNPTLTSLHLTPHTITLAPGAVQQFSPVGNWSDGSSGLVGVVYTEVSGGSISTNGFYVAGSNPGIYRVVAAQQGGSRADTAVVTIGAGHTLNQVSLNPAVVTLAPGASQQFSVAGIWSDGSSAAPSVTYTATGGTIGPDGVFTAGTSLGTYAVIATQEGGVLADTSVVDITPSGGPGLTQLVMNPSAVTLLPGGTQLFTVSASWSDGSSTLPALSFNATGGTISTGGVFTAGNTPGTYQVIVKQQGGTKADTSTVTIPLLTGLSLTPKPVTVPAAGSQLFSVTGTWNNGATTPPQVTYNATGGTINPAGLYLAGSTLGTFRVIAVHSFGSRADTSVVTISDPVPPPPTGVGPGDLVVFPNQSVEFILGPQLRSGSAANPWPWFDANQITRGLVHGAAFPATPVNAPLNQDDYGLMNYYDLAQNLYNAYYRTGNPQFLTYARKVADSWWLMSPQIASGTNLSGPSYEDTRPAPRSVGLGGLMLRALDGRPEMWPWIVNYAQKEYQNWIGAHIDSDRLNNGVRDGGYVLLFVAWLAKVHPDPAVRADFYSKALHAAKDYYARLQYPDGSWRWYDPQPSGYLSQPFMVGLLLEGMIATHRLTGDNTVRQSILDGVTALYRDAWRTDNMGLTGAPYAPLRWRAFVYILYGDALGGQGCALPINWSTQIYCAPVTTPNGFDTIREQRSNNGMIVHAFGYAFKISGNPQFRTWGDEIFAATFGKGQGPGADAMYGLADYLPKQYNQNYRSAGRYLVWRLGN